MHIVESHNCTKVREHARVLVVGRAGGASGRDGRTGSSVAWLGVSRRAFGEPVRGLLRASWVSMGV